VDLFFVISGFCLAYPILVARRTGKGGDFSPETFFAKRFTRILPPYYATIVLCLFAWFIFQMLRVSPPTAFNPNLRIGDIIAQFFMMDRGTYLVNGSFWTLFIEFRWYFMFPFLLLLWIRSARAYFLLMTCLVIAYALTCARSIDIGVLPAFMLGIVAADVHIGKPAWLKYTPILTCVAFDIALLLEPYSSSPDSSGIEQRAFYGQGNIGWYLTCFFFVQAGGSWAPLRALLETPPLVFIGTISYSIYLVHQPIVSYISERLGKTLGDTGAFAASFIASIVVGGIFWWLIERRFQHGSTLYDELVKELRVRIGVLLDYLKISRTVRIPQGTPRFRR
jgi:peptidoglycan/LPS O-acetylase OafA/YrhL